MFIGFVYRLRDAGVKVGVTETVALADALARGVHGHTLDGFYYVARAILVHHEGHLDAFDQAFLAEFTGADGQLPALSEELLEWLDETRRATRIADDQQAPSAEQIAEWRALLEARLAEQTERHDGGNYWIGTGGSSPHGQGGSAAAGLSTGSSGGGRSAVRIADARAYRGYRSDVTLDIRQFEVALRRLRAFVREGAALELDMDNTIDATARNAGDIEVVTRAPRRPDTHVILMADVGGSMTPYAHLVSQLFSATKKSTHFKDLQTYYFHNCPYGKVFETERFTEPVWLPDLLRRFPPHYKLIMVGDAYMADYELHMRTPAAPDDTEGVSGLGWLRMLREHFSQSVWLNPEHSSRWQGTSIADIGGVFDMYPMSVDGLTEAMAALNRGIRHTTG